jgi:hypothetical protein
MGIVWLQNGRRRTEPEEVAGKMLPVFAFSVTLPVNRWERRSVAGWASGSGRQQQLAGFLASCRNHANCGGGGLQPQPLGRLLREAPRARSAWVMSSGMLRNFGIGISFLSEKKYVPAFSNFL